MSLKIQSYFTRELSENIEKNLDWEKTDIDITDDGGKPLFTQKGVEFPNTWSSLARKIVASKYFFGEIGVNRENSLRQLVDRVAKTMAEWGLKQNYFVEEEANVFEDELKFLAIDQRMAFNSPVWFNVGTHIYEEENKKHDEKEAYVFEDGKIVKMPLGKETFYPQTSACFIQSVNDNMESIMELAKREALLFKYGSGTGTNLSTLRSSREKLSGGGKPSGPLAYWSFYDKVAGIVKSGGKTRRAAKMDILNISHPDILEFIESKAKEEKKIHLMIDNGIEWKDAIESCNFQNTNISVRASDEFMKAVVNDADWKTIPIHNKEMANQMPIYKAKELLRKIAEMTHFCGDPGMQFDDIINKWHTCKNSERINASNPCSEYMFVDNSSCNLASLNLMKFVKEDVFQIEDFKQAIRFTAIAQDLEIDNSSYPTKDIAENSHKYRPLGMGYANLGALLMSLGIPYDSEESRAVAGVVSALLTGSVYETSTEMAEAIGTFEEFEKNKEPMLEVMGLHKEALKNIDKSKLPFGFKDVFDEAEKTWERVIERGKKYGFRNAQATVLAPTGTIGFMMDCDTKGIEPEIGLVQVKLLSDGGILKLVNNTIKHGLKKLGYDDVEIKEIVDYIKENETIEGVKYLKEEHLAVFDCANKPVNGKRTISYHGHLKMMAAVQPFISGAISKTVNLPKEAGVDEIEKVYIEAWKLGLKAVALYRDQSKRIQPLNFSKKQIEYKAVRRKLPTTRKSVTHKFDIAGHEGYITVGCYEDGNPGETFITMNKEGSTIGGLMDAFATSLSMNLQYGVPLSDLINKFKHQRFEPRGIVWEGHKDIKTADSVIDYIFTFLEKEFLANGKTKEKMKEIEIVEEKKTEKQQEQEREIAPSEKGGLCPVCGGQMIMRGHCFEVCEKCGHENQNGCGG